MPLTNNAPIDWSQIKHFKKEEFTCNCGCGLNNIHKEVVLMLDAAREIAGVPFRINCGCRCEKHYREVGGHCDLPRDSKLRIPESDTRETDGGC